MDTRTETEAGVIRQRRGEADDATEATTSRHAATAEPAVPPTPMLWAAGLSVFAATMLVVVGLFQFLEGLAAIIDDSLLLTVGDYAFEMDVTAWGWTHMIIGGLACITGVFVFLGQAWARGVGIAFACLSAIANFLYIPYYPLWSILLIGLSVAVIWALAVYDPRRMEALR